jgi:glycosyltransferase involved in cell wall biosynthesis
MRILEIVDVRWWNACAYYGVELARALQAAGEDVVVAASPESPPAVAARGLGLPVWSDVCFADANPWRTARDFPRLTRALRRYDLVDAHRAEGHLLAAAASAFMNGPPVVRTRGDIRLPRRGPGRGLLNGKLTAAHIVPGEFMRERLVHECGIPASRVAVIPAGIDLERYTPAGSAGGELRRALGIGGEEPVIGMVARLSPVKGHEVVLAALAALAREGLRPHFLVAGADAEIAARDLARAARAAGLGERVHWLGFQDDVRPVLAALDVLVVASLGSEAISRVVLEGMAMSLPVVGTRVGVVPELIADGVTGRLVPAGDADALAQALAPLVTDRALARGMGGRGRERAQVEYGLGRWVERTRSLYRRVIGESPIGSSSG